MNKQLIKAIDDIRKLLSENDINKAYHNLISLNTINEDTDNYTCYFEEDEDGNILVESPLGDYVLANTIDIEETLKDIEKFIIQGGK